MQNEVAQLVEKRRIVEADKRKIAEVGHSVFFFVMTQLFLEDSLPFLRTICRHVHKLGCPHYSLTVP